MVDIAVAKKRGRPAKGTTATRATATRPSKPKGRGRPPKVATVSSKNIETSIKGSAGSGKGRGRPRKEPVPENDEGVGKPLKQKRAYKSKRQVGRPRKLQASGEDKDITEKKVRRSVGRPSTGAVKWNIVHTGRKVGRPKKEQYNEDGSRKKRGRPSFSNKASPNKLSRPNNTSPRFAVDDSEEEPKVKSAQELDETLELIAFKPTPKKRGRPPLTKI